MNAFDVTVSGVALSTQGIAGLGFAFNSLSLLTDGFITPCSALWTPADPEITTVWIPVTNNSMEICFD